MIDFTGMSLEQVEIAYKEQHFALYNKGSVPSAALLALQTELKRYCFELRPAYKYSDLLTADEKFMTALEAAGYNVENVRVVFARVDSKNTTPGTIYFAHSIVRGKTEKFTSRAEDKDEWKRSALDHGGPVLVELDVENHIMKRVNADFKIATAQETMYCISGHDSRVNYGYVVRQMTMKRWKDIFVVQNPENDYLATMFFTAHLLDGSCATKTYSMTAPSHSVLVDYTIIGEDTVKNFPFAIFHENGSYAEIADVKNPSVPYSRYLGERSNEMITGDAICDFLIAIGAINTMPIRGSNLIHLEWDSHGLWSTAPWYTKEWIDSTKEFVTDWNKHVADSYNSMGKSARIPFKV